MFDTGHSRDSSVTALLGPTNTGKTHHAIERMLAHRTGVIGLPLRLLAREVYDRIVALRGPSVVALVTGEERIVPPRTQYWVCTVEAMPPGLGADFVAVDEIQLCGDPERGHVFTDRLLNARGLHETMFLGAETMRARIASLIPRARIERRDRFSRLSYAGARKLSRLPERSAIVGFSVEAVYAIAELLRRQRGGAAVVMGALSPRTRNAQVALYQNGDVDFMVATDAIGMGLNLDLRHVAFSGLSKFDGRRHRRLQTSELAQIAGRAGRHRDDGSFGVTGEADPLDPDTVAAIEEHRFPPVARLVWRNSRLDFGSVPALIAALEAAPDHPDLIRAREADDLAALRALSADPAIARTLTGPQAIRRLWEICQIPDFRKVGAAEHHALLARIYGFLAGRRGCIPSDWLAGQLRRIDRTDGDIDALSKRLAYVRTWTYVAQRAGWVGDEELWREETRAVEDRLSDALHARLTQRFVDRRTSVLVRRLKQRERLVAEVSSDGSVTVEGHPLGRLEGFMFRPDPDAAGEEARRLRNAAAQALQAELNRRADRLYNAPDPEIGLTEQGGLMWGDAAVGRLVPGADPLSPGVRAFVDEDADPSVSERVTRRLTHWINRRIAQNFEPLIKLRDDATLQGLARGVAFRLVEAMGVIPREEIAADVKALDQEARASLRRHGVRFGQYTLFQAQLLKPAPTQLRLVLWGLAAGLEEFPAPPPPGLVTIPAPEGMPEGYWPRAGYRRAGARAIRIDMLERLADLIRSRDTRSGFEAAPEMLSITGLSLEQFAGLMQGLGYRVERGERPRTRPPAAGAAPAPGAAPAEATAPQDAPADGAQAQAADPGTAPAKTPAAEAPAAEGAPAETSAPESPAAEGAPAETPATGSAEAEGAEGAGATPAQATAPDDAPADRPSGETRQAAQAMEVYYVFRWAPPRRGDGARGRKGRRQGGATAAPREGAAAATEGEGASEAGRPRGGGARARRGESPAGQPGDKGRRHDQPRDRKEGRKDGRKDGRKEARDRPRVFTAAPPDADRPAVDPDNPFAALMALKRPRE
ncbi:MAG: ATP-dependent helicase MgpS [Paracoccaceae bacterium]|nr:MAG: ATP-dependent helicase MgpS [Paracoccaceae bacterium]